MLAQPHAKNQGSAAMTVEGNAAFVCAWMATYILHSTLLLGVAWTVTARLQSRFDRLAEQTWRAALGLPIVTSLAQQWIVSTNTVGATTLGAIGYSPQPLRASQVPSAVWIGGTTVWLAGALIGLAQLYLCQRRLHRQVRNRAPLPAVRERQVSNLLDGERIRISVVRDLAIPFALRNEICLPEWLLDRMALAELRAVIAHELAHVKRRDALWRPAISVIPRAFFFQPLNWIAVERLRELSECICDEEAVAATKSPVSLAVALETVASKVVRSRDNLALAPAMGGPVSLTVRRVGRILSNSQSVPAPPLRIAAGQQVGVLLVACIAAILFAPRVSLPAIAFQRYTIDAGDRAGPFTVTIEKGRAVGATIAGQKLDSRQVRQNGAVLELIDNDARVLSLQLTAAGGIRWIPRRPIEPHR
jgi:beta-lactamase regulating signal transducer with metallopeptidase domain